MNENQGSVVNVLSSHTPATSKPIVGTNMRQVASAAVPSNKITGDFSVGVGRSSLVLGDLVIYVYTVTESCTIVNTWHERKFQNLCTQQSPKNTMASVAMSANDRRVKPPTY